jgi:threonine dehydrogenase-like Zn-dependent dehydrogenase
MLRSVEYARNHGVVLHVRSSFNDNEGTWVRKEEELMEQAIISGIAHDTSEAKMTVLGVPDRPGIAARLFRALALELGAEAALAELAELDAADVVVLSVGNAELVAGAVGKAAPGGRVVLFAGFGDAARAELDLNRLHYEEIAVVGSEWIGTPPNQRRGHYAAALELLGSGRAPLERLVTATCGLDGLRAAFEDQRALRGLKTMLVPGR